MTLDMGEQVWVSLEVDAGRHVLPTRTAQWSAEPQAVCAAC